MANRVVYGWDDTPETMPEYIKYKLKLLKQMDIRLTDAEKAHMDKLETQIQVDDYAHRLIMEKL